MSWVWRYEDADGAPVEGPEAEDFTNQSDAESWLGETWKDLLAAGIEQVSLLEDDAVVYEHMSLRAAEG
ncbi:hypothetical protein ACWGR4_47510 [Embleya sp. NPDC055664]|uniref:Uncharacterized protein n=1 Tax=Embleya scabrispora TaxID=159449 RepID=A0A1T3P2B4_9ACTN|nr:hypothetical protein [Embleya scabrispora]OPC83223.1 hypothetical protein B4N89_21820 [Embleya scabrispora]